MGHDVRFVGNHSLNIGSLEELAKDLSVRFQVNIEYGYQDEYSFDIANGTDLSTFNHITLGVVAPYENTITLFLTDQLYQQHLLYQQYGDTLFESPFFTSQRQIDDWKANIHNKNYDLHRFGEIEEYWCEIFNDALHCDLLYYWNKWWSLCREFTVENDWWGDCKFEFINSFRLKLRGFYKQVGGNIILYCDDQGEDQDLSYPVYSWNELLHEIQSRFGERVLNVSEFMKTQQLREYRDYPPVFYDDFADLKQITTEYTIQCLH